MYDYTVATNPFEDVFIDDLHGLAKSIFGSVERSELAWKLSRMPDVSVHFARGDRMVGFKIGYAVGPARYYSWLGGVDPDHRRRGIALRMLEDQHSWARAHRYTSIETSLVPTNTAMLTLNLRVGFQVIGMYTRDEMPRVTLLKRL